MRIASLLTFVAGLAVAGGSAWLAGDFFEAKYARANATNERDDGLVTVVVASQNIPFGQIVDATKLETISWPAAALPKGSFTDYAGLLPGAGSQPRRARTPIAQGELMLASKLSDFGEKVTIVQSLGPNSRAIAIKVNAETGVGGFVTPGDRVDILLTQGRDKTLKTVTILQNIRVIGVDQEANENTDRPEIARTVTVEVSPNDGQKLALAQKAGTLSLTLRTLEETEVLPLEAISLRDVLREPEPAPVADAPAPVPTVRSVIVRRGVVATETELR